MLTFLHFFTFTFTPGMLGLFCGIVSYVDNVGTYSNTRGIENPYSHSEFDFSVLIMWEFFHTEGELQKT